MALSLTDFQRLLEKAHNNDTTPQAIKGSGANEKQKRLLLKTLSASKSTSSASKTASTAASGFGELTKGAKGAAGALSDLAGGTTIAEKALVSLGGNTVDLINGLTKATSASDLFGTAVGKGIFGSLEKALTAISPVIDDIEKYRIGLNKSGVDGRQFILNLRKQQDALAAYNVTFQSLNEAFTNFQTNLAATVSTSFPRQRDELLKIAAVNEKFGVSIGTSTRFINQLDTGLQLSAQQTDRFSRRLMKFAIDTGQPVTKVFDDFTSSASNFFVELDPDKALKKFTVFQQMARRLGTEVSSLTRLTDNFETIEGGMEFGGKLNMLLSNLGGSFDAVQATLMTQPERMQYIANQVGKVGDRIKGMSDLGQRAILRELASTLNVDVGMIRSLINRDKTAEIDKFVQGTTGLMAMGAEEQAQRAREMTTRAEKVQITNEQLMGKFTMSAERALQAATDFRQGMVRIGQAFALNKLDRLAPTINKYAEMGEKAALQMNTNVKEFSKKTGEAIYKQITATDKNTAALNRVTRIARGQSASPPAPAPQTSTTAPMSGAPAQTMTPVSQTMSGASN